MLTTRNTVDINKIPALVEKYRGDLKFIADANPYFNYIPRNAIKDNEGCFDVLDDIVDAIAGLL